MPCINDGGPIEVTDPPGFDAVFHLALPIAVAEDGLRVNATFFAIGGGAPQVYIV